MKLRIFVLASALGLVGTTGVVYGAATGADFDLELVPAASTLYAPAGGAVDLDVVLKTRIDKTQGWSYGLVFQNDASVTAEITQLKGGAIIGTLYNGNPAEFKSLTWYRADDSLGADCYLLSPSGVCTDVEAASFTEGIVIHMMQMVTMPPKPDGIVTAELTVEASGPEDAQVRLAFVDTAGDPDIATVIVHGGLSYVPNVKAGATITFVKPTCALPAPYTVEIEGGSGVSYAQVESLVTLNFNADGSMAGEEIQAWSYGLCIKDPSLLAVVGASSDGTETATAKGGAAPDFDVTSIFPEGLTHAVAMSLEEPLATIPAENDWTDLRATYEILMSQQGDATYVTPCDLVLGDPVVRNVMSVEGLSYPMSTFEGTDPQDPVTGCCDPEICNVPGRFEFLAAFSFVPGSANNDGILDIADGVYLLNFLFRGGPPLPCELAGDANGDCALDSSDAVYVIEYIFLEGQPPARGIGCQVIMPDECPNLKCDIAVESGCSR